MIFFFQAEDGIRDIGVTGVQTCALPIFTRRVELSENCSFKVEGVGPGPFTLVSSATEDEINYSDVRVVEVGATGLKDLEIPVMPDFDIKGQVRLDAINNQRDIPRFAVEFAHME